MPGAAIRRTIRHTIRHTICAAIRHITHIHPVAGGAHGCIGAGRHLACQCIGQVLVVPGQADGVTVLVALRGMHQAGKALVVALGVAEHVIGHTCPIHREQHRRIQATRHPGLQRRQACGVACHPGRVSRQVTAGMQADVQPATTRKHRRVVQRDAGLPQQAQRAGQLGLAQRKGQHLAPAQGVGQHHRGCWLLGMGGMQGAGVVVCAGQAGTELPAAHQVAVRRGDRLAKARRGRCHQRRCLRRHDLELNRQLGKQRGLLLRRLVQQQGAHRHRIGGAGQVVQAGDQAGFKAQVGVGKGQRTGGQWRPRIVLRQAQKSHGECGTVPVLREGQQVEFSRGDGHGGQPLCVD